MKAKTTALILALCLCLTGCDFSDKAQKAAIGASAISDLGLALLPSLAPSLKPELVTAIRDGLSKHVKPISAKILQFLIEHPNLDKAGKAEVIDMFGDLAGYLDELLILEAIEIKDPVVRARVQAWLGTIKSVADFAVSQLSDTQKAQLQAKRSEKRIILPEK